MRRKKNRLISVLSQNQRQTFRPALKMFVDSLLVYFGNTLTAVTSAQQLKTGNQLPANTSERRRGMIVIVFKTDASVAQFKSVRCQFLRYDFRRHALRKYQNDVFLFCHFILP